MSGGLVYHWKHGWIPRTPTAALQKAHGSRKGADKLMSKHGINGALPGGGGKKASAPSPSKADKPAVAESRTEVSAPGSWTARQAPDGSVQVLGKSGAEIGRVRLVTTGKHKGQWEARYDGRHGADYASSPEKGIDALYDSVHGQPGAAALARSGGSPEERRLAAYKAAIREHQRSQAPAVDPHAARAAQLREAAAKKRAEADRIANGAGVNDRAAAMLSGRTHQRQVARDDAALRRYTETQQRAKALESKAYLAEGRAKSAVEKQRAADLNLKPSDVTPGDMVLHNGRLQIVTKVNKTTVNVPTGYSWDEKVQLSKVTRHVPLSTQSDDAIRNAYHKAADPKVKNVLRAELLRRGLKVEQ